MSTIAEILTEIADTVRNVMVTTTDIDVQVEGRMVLNPTPPCIDMYPGDPSLDPELAAFGDLNGGEILTVRARVTTADTDAGQELLLALMDDEDDLSVVLALTDDPTLNGMGRIDVTGRTGYALFPVPSGDGALLGCTWQVSVLKVRS